MWKPLSTPPKPLSLAAGLALGAALLTGGPAHAGPPDDPSVVTFADGLSVGKPGGEMLMLVPRHVCPTVNLAEQALYVRRDGTAEVIDIAARAHPLLYTPA